MQAKEVLEAFRPLVAKYVGLLTNPGVRLRGRDTMQFLSLFVPDEARRELLGGSPSLKAMIHAAKVVKLLQRAFQDTDPDELAADLNAVLLSLASRYRDTGRDLATYIASTFRYEVYRFVLPKLGELSTVPVEDPGLGPAPGEPDDEERLRGYAWQMGLTAEAPFDRLTPFERYLVRERWLRGRTVKAIAECTGFSSSYISARLTRVKEAIAQCSPSWSTAI